MYDLNTRFCAAIARSSRERLAFGARRRQRHRRARGCGGHDGVDQRGARSEAEHREHRGLVVRRRADVAAREGARGPRARRGDARGASHACACRAWRFRGSGLADQLLVGGGVEELLDVGGIGGLDAEHPGAVGVLVDLLRRAAAARRWRRRPRRRPARRCRRRPSPTRPRRRPRRPRPCARRRAARRTRCRPALLRVVGDADVTVPSASRAHPLVRLGVFEVLRDVHAWLRFFASGYCDEDLAVAHERRLHHARRELLVAHRDVHDVAGRHAARQARERDRLAERRARTCRW